MIEILSRIIIKYIEHLDTQVHNKKLASYYIFHEDKEKDREFKWTYKWNTFNNYNFILQQYPNKPNIAMDALSQK